MAMKLPGFPRLSACCCFDHLKDRKSYLINIYVYVTFLIFPGYRLYNNLNKVINTKYVHLLSSAHKLKNNNNLKVRYECTAIINNIGTQ